MEIDLQLARADLQAPAAAQLQNWAEAALDAAHGQARELTIRVADEAESAELNQRYRGKQGPTNVLSFPFDEPAGIDTGLLGDLVICAPVVEREADEQGKELDAHWAHMVVHGVLHLCGFDHIDEAQAQEMENLERQVMQTLGFDDPYNG